MGVKKTIGVMAAIITLLNVVLLPAYVFAYNDMSVSALDDSGSKVTGWLKSIARSGLMKAIFAGALFLAIILILSPKHRTFGLVVLIFVLLIGIYSGLVDGLWNMLTGAGG